MIRNQDVYILVEFGFPYTLIFDKEIQDKLVFIKLFDICIVERYSKYNTHFKYILYNAEVTENMKL